LEPSSSVSLSLPVSAVWTCFFRIFVSSLGLSLVIKMRKYTNTKNTKIQTYENAKVQKNQKHRQHTNEYNKYKNPQMQKIHKCKIHPRIQKSQNPKMQNL